MAINREIYDKEEKEKWCQIVNGCFLCCWFW